jgi:hypothetical protein
MRAIILAAVGLALASQTGLAEDGDICGVCKEKFVAVMRGHACACTTIPAPADLLERTRPVMPNPAAPTGIINLQRRFIDPGYRG